MARASRPWAHAQDARVTFPIGFFRQTRYVSKQALSGEISPDLIGSHKPETELRSVKGKLKWLEAALLSS